jgi:hypothetical protein
LKNLAIVRVSLMLGGANTEYFQNSGGKNSSDLINNFEKFGGGSVFSKIHSTCTSPRETLGVIILKTKVKHTRKQNKLVRKCPITLSVILLFEDFIKIENNYVKRGLNFDHH